MRIGQLSKRTGVPVDTIRYYERNGLLPPPVRRASGYRSYQDSDAQRLAFIRRGKDMGFTLQEIRELMALSGGTDIAAVRAAAQDKLADVDRRLSELQRIRAGLAVLVDTCPGRGQADQCPILGALHGDTP